MRKITEQATQAFKDMKNFKAGNTRVDIEDRVLDGKYITCAVMYLHDNQIAIYDGKLLTIRDAGWQSVTTKERLNGILQAFGLGYISQKNWSWLIKNSKHETVLNWLGTAQFEV